MSNTASLAPPFTRENAAEMARRATASRVARLAREKAEQRQREIEALALAIERETKPEPDDARKLKILKQIDEYLDDMKGATLKERLLIGRAIADLWRLVKPTAGVEKPPRKDRRPAAPTPEIGTDGQSAPQ